MALVLSLTSQQCSSGDSRSITLNTLQETATMNLVKLQETPQPVLLADYTPPSHLIKTIHLCFELDNDKCTVTSEMAIVQNQDSISTLKLDGCDLKLLSVAINGTPLKEDQFQVSDRYLTIFETPKTFTLQIKTEIDPKNNKALEGLYKSGEIYCTQNEPEGMRKITYFLDRPDVMAKYTTKIIADKKLFPVLLSNGNEIGKGSLPDGKHFVEWEDPFPKPSYLFAVVAGDLGSISDTFTTMSGRKIALKIYCDKGNESKCHHAMQSLIKAMRWDEEVYGLEYDLDTYMIVAVDAFNMGAMENKGLNIFNTSCSLADDATATDDNYHRIEGVIAHEYFHNWTGNRVTCRDWFQLTLKEGLTVFRDQEFSADMHSRALERIENVLALKASQFPEDAGPTAHPIKPKSYLQINNFYTSTIYNKGAEVIRMIRTLIGHETFYKGITKYFELYDGQAVTTDEFINAMEIASGRNFDQFKRWYTQAGTPKIDVSGSYNASTHCYVMKITQSCIDTADKSEKKPFHFPLALGLLNSKGHDMPLKIDGNILTRPFIEITKEQEEFIFEDIHEMPILSINRHFSAPVEVKIDCTLEDYKFLMANDTDPYNRWESGQVLATELMLKMIEDLNEGKEIALDEAFITAFGAILNDAKLDNALKARALILPSEESLQQRTTPIDIDGIHVIREYTRHMLAERFENQFKELYLALHRHEPYQFNAKACGDRSLKNVCLGYLCALETPFAIELCNKQFEDANNMTDKFVALALLSNIDCKARESSLAAFYAKWKDDTLVMNKWLAVQALSKLDGTIEAVFSLMKNSVYDPTIPNHVRALITSFTQNSIHFHRNDGMGYAFVADRIIEIDKYNPQVAAGLARTFKKFDKLDSMRRTVMRTHLERIAAQPGLSTNVLELVSQLLSWESKSN